MNKTQLLNTIKYLITKLPKNTNWVLEGSANLKIQGLNTKVNDIDISTNNQGFNNFKSALNEFLIKEYFSEKTNAKTLLFKINNIEIEVLFYQDQNINYLENKIIKQINNLQIPLISLDKLKQFYQNINREEKVLMIEKHINQ